MTAIHLDRLKAALADRYTIDRELGAGGMATVYLARDLKHDRRVALKVLRPELSAILGPERFLNEIRLTANLQHPNLLPLFDSGTTDELLYYVMPFVEGQSLRQRLAREKQLPIDQAIRITVEVASALDYAHQHGVIHRDIKPENILLEPSRAVIADFGIALAVRSAGGARLTETGLSLGTPQYMSPEQATGDRDLDARSDVYSLGCVLYEMLAGEPPHTGPTVQAVIAKVLTDRPRPVSELRETVPTDIADALEQALAKLPADRFASTAEFAAALEDRGTGASIRSRARLLREGRTAARATGHGLTPGSGARRWAAVATIGIAAVLALVWGPRGDGRAPGIAAHLTVQLPEGVILPIGTEHPVLALSPDGTRLVFVGDERGTSRLYLRDLADPVARPLAGTEGAVDPFFSPDGAWITFFSGPMIKKVAVGGGAPAPVHAATPGTVSRGAAWLTSDTLVHAGSPNSGLTRAASGGENASRHQDWAYLTAEIDAPYAWPAVLPGGRSVLFTNVIGQTPDQSQVNVLSVADKRVANLVSGGTYPRYSATGHLLFARAGALYAAPFDVDRARATGPETKVLDGVIVEPNGAAQYAVSATGTLAYVSGPVVVRRDELVWVDRSGRSVTVRDDGREYSFPRLSPDGARLAVTSPTGSNYDVWILDLRRGTLQPVTTTPGEDFEPVWHPDGTRLAISGEREDEEGPTLALTRGPDFRLEFPLRTPKVGNWEMPTSWSPDGRWLAFTRHRDTVATDVEILPASGEPVPVPFASDGAAESAAMFSPDGRYVAYVSDVSGRDEVYVKPFPGPGQALPVSTDGGIEPVWRRDGSELFYREGDALKSARLTQGGQLERGVPTTVFEGRYQRAPYGGLSANYDVSLDGQRFLMVRRKDLPRPTTIQVVLNWPEALTRPAAPPKQSP